MHVDIVAYEIYATKNASEYTFFKGIECKISSKSKFWLMSSVTTHK